MVAVAQTATHAWDSRTKLRVRAATAEIIEGPDSGRTVRIEQPAFTVGSGPGADLRLTDSAVSREHVRISLATDGLRITDAGSKNGTWMGAVRVTDIVLTGDAALELGKTKLFVRIDPVETELPLSANVVFGDAIGASAPMRHVFALLERAAATDITVLLEGESGTGKEVLARAVHAMSPRALGPFITVDCGAIPQNLMESELFGHERGAFTGATQTRTGLFERADGGTIFLDEIGELSADLQPKLLRLLETREVRAVGSNESRRVSVRVIAATNRRLGEAVNQGEFRRDLYYRLAVARVVVPPLRDRRDDVPALSRAFLCSVTGREQELPPDLQAMLTAYTWPGNVRELRNVIERWVLLGVRDASALFDATRERPPSEDLSSLPYHDARQLVLDRFERAYLEKVLAQNDGVMSHAAEKAGVTRATLYRMLERVRLMRSEKRDDQGIAATAARLSAAP